MSKSSTPGGPGGSEARGPESDGDLDAILSETESAGNVARAALRGSLSAALEHVEDVLGADARAEIRSIEDLSRIIDLAVANIDRLVSEQLNRVMHAPPFQELEASWRGLFALIAWRTEVCDTDEIDIRVRVLTISRKEIERDVQHYVEFDQSLLFGKIYSAEFGMPGGRPYGVILADYELHAVLSATHAFDDIGIAERLAEIGGAALAPVVAAAHPSFFECENFADIARLRDLESVLATSSWYRRWTRFRKSDDSRYLALTVPRLLTRRLYEADGMGAWGFRFEEDAVERTESADTPGHFVERDVHLFGTAVYAYGAVLMRAYADTCWFADIRGTRVDEDGGGIVPHPTVSSFATDAPGVAAKFGTDAFLTPRVESQLNNLGFLPLNRCWLTNRMAFHGSQSVQDPAVYSGEIPTANARIMALLQYVLCASRFGHYIKVMARDMVGSFTTAQECERFLTRWLHDYTANIDHLPEESRARTPLREASVTVREDAASPGNYRVIAHLRPHYQADDLVSTLKLVTEISPTGS